jgi:hypothetical protein
MPSKNKTPLRAVIARNHLPCDVAGCQRMRIGAARHCEPHRERRWRYGHPLGRRIYMKDYAAERKEVAALFAAYPEHPGIRSACKWLRDWIEAAGRGEQVPGTIHVARVHRYEVPALAVLTELCAVWLHVERHRFPDDQRLTFALAIAMLSLAPRDHLKSWHYKSGERRHYRNYGYDVRKDVGDYIRLNLAALFVNVVRGVEHLHHTEREARASLSAPFTNTTNTTGVQQQ